MILGPRGNGTDPYARCFEELDDAVKAIRCTDDVIFNAHSFAPPPTGILYNTDVVGMVVTDDNGGKVDLQPKHPWFDGRRHWDIFQRNVERWRSAGQNAEHVPVGWHPTMKRFHRAEESDIDVVFSGRVNDRRKAVIDALKAYGLQVVVLTGPPNPELRDHFLARAKIALNMLYYPAERGSLYPVLRAAHLVANGVPMVSEFAPERPYWTGLATHYEQLANDIKELCRPGMAHARAKLAETALERFQKEPLTLPVS